MQSNPCDGRRWASSAFWSSAYEQTVKAWAEVGWPTAATTGVWLSWTLLAKRLRRYTIEANNVLTIP